MNSDEFVSKLSDRLNIDKDAAKELVASLSDIISESLQNERNISLGKLGGLEVKNEKEHIVVNKSTMQRILVPPSLNIYFIPSENLLNKTNVI